MGSGFLGQQAGCQEPALSALIIFYFLSTFTTVPGLCPACWPRNPVFSASNKVHLSGQSQVNYAQETDVFKPQ